jgi:molybdopterin-guanine dinucleotide biosynthesis protein A
MEGFVLAGGQSRRMGRDKAGIRWRQGTLLDHMIRLLSTVSHPVRVVGRGKLPDRIPGCGPLGGIQTALDATASEWNLIVAVDLPLLTPQFLERLKLRALTSPRKLVAVRVRRRFPLCLAVHRSLGPGLAEHLAAGRLAVHRWVEAAGAEILTMADVRGWGLDSSIFTNLNTPEALSQRERAARTPKAEG